MESLISYLPKVDDKALEFEVSIQDVQFNHEGRYFLRLSVQSLHTKDYSKVQVRKPGSLIFTYEYEAETDVVRQPESQVLTRFHDNTFTFRLPTGRRPLNRIFMPLAWRVRRGRQVIGLSVRLSVIPSRLHNYKVQHLKFGWRYSNQTWKFIYRLLTPRLYHMPGPWGWSGFKINGLYILTLLPSRTSVLHKYMSSCLWRLVVLLIHILCHGDSLYLKL